jgi:hypothetical protein
MGYLLSEAPEMTSQPIDLSAGISPRIGAAPQLREWVALISLKCQCLFATRFFEARDVLEPADRQA